MAPGEEKCSQGLEGPMPSLYSSISNGVEIHESEDPRSSTTFALDHKISRSTSSVDSGVLDATRTTQAVAGTTDVEALMPMKISPLRPSTQAADENAPERDAMHGSAGSDDTDASAGRKHVHDGDISSIPITPSKLVHKSPLDATKEESRQGDKLQGSVGFNGTEANVGQKRKHDVEEPSIPTGPRNMPKKSSLVFRPLASKKPKPQIPKQKALPQTFTGNKKNGGDVESATPKTSSATLMAGPTEKALRPKSKRVLSPSRKPKATKGLPTFPWDDDEESSGDGMPDTKGKRCHWG